MKAIQVDELLRFAQAALEAAGVGAEDARTIANTLVTTDTFGVFSHGTNNLYNYIRKMQAGGLDAKAVPTVEKEGPSWAIVNGNAAMGMVSSCRAMNLAIEKAKKTGIAYVGVHNSCHFGAAGYYANMAARQGLIGISMSNVDPNMTAPGARGMLLGNNPFAYAAPSESVPTVFLDIALSNVASLKVVQARRDGRQIPDTWIVDKDGLPTTDPSHYPEEGAMQPMAAHKGYGLAVMVDLLTGILAGSDTSMSGKIVSWCFEPEKPNNVTHTFIAVNPELLCGKPAVASDVEQMAQILRNAPKARGTERIFTPGEIEWGKHKAAEENGLRLPPDVEVSLQELSADLGLELPLH